ncbi:MAG: hypothetical protein MZW92_78340 [Comamonadaceae bacterium]|nr:hypothetical protein [Comamonadaceae bacterium]
MNPNLAKLQPYPFETPAPAVRRRRAAVRPEADPAVHRRAAASRRRRSSRQALTRTAWAGWRIIPRRRAPTRCAAPSPRWIGRRYGLPAPDPATQVLPVNGSREALFAFAQCVRRRQRAPTPLVRLPNPVLPDLRGRGAAGRRAAAASSITCRTTASRWTGRACRRTCWAARATGLRLLAGQPHRQGA